MATNAKVTVPTDGGGGAFVGGSGGSDGGADGGGSGGSEGTGNDGGSHPEACSHECADLMVPWHEQCGNQEQIPDQELLYSYCLQTLGRDPCQAGDAWGLCPGMPGGGGHRADGQPGGES